MRKKEYIIPAISRTISVDLETPILAGSVVDSFNAGGVMTQSQEVESKDFDDPTSFNHQWE